MSSFLRPPTQAVATIAANVPPLIHPAPPAPPAVPLVPPAVYSLVIGPVDVVDDPLLTETETIRQILHWIGFNIIDNRTNLMNESIGTLDDVLSLNQKDVISFNPTGLAEPQPTVDSTSAPDA